MTDSRSDDLRWGIAGLCGAAVLAVAIGVVHATGSTSENVYTAELAQAGALRTGDDVRLAGVPVGQVESLSLLPDRVRMTFTVRDDVFLGDQTILDVRMLTVVGGYYVAVQPSGTRPLGSAVIPRDRVILPYNLTKLFQDAIAPIEEIDGDLVRQNLAALSDAVHDSPDAVHAALRATEDLIDLMNKQNSDISRALSMADEYLTAINRSSDVLVRLVQQLRTLELIVYNHKTSIGQALEDVADVLHKVSPLGRAWDATLKDRAAPLAEAAPKLAELGAHLGALVDALRDMQNRLLPLLSPGEGVRIDQSAVTLLPERICVPIPGGQC
ncbi:MlaD family protein [Nocardia sp. NPDC004654]|uniref:MlaD family protein n=1 Tax=Nocardia sp. NPDC004654 TaxID=3154776 RepID=UPI0033B50C32